MSNEDGKQLEQFRQGKPEAFDELYATYGPRLYRFCLRLCGSPTDAEDLTQEVFVAAFRSLHRFEGRSSLATYLYRIAVYRRRQIKDERRIETVPWEDERDAGSEAEDPSRIGLAKMELEDALATLPESQRVAFLLVKAEGFTCREAAEMLGIPIGTVKYHVYEAVARLQAHLREPRTAPHPVSRKEPCDAL